MNGYIKIPVPFGWEGALGLLSTYPVFGVALTGTVLTVIGGM